MNHVFMAVMLDGLTLSEYYHSLHTSKSYAFDTFYRHVVEFFTMVSPMLSDLSNLLDTITWFTTNGRQLPGKAVSIVRCFFFYTLLIGKNLLKKKAVEE